MERRVRPMESQAIRTQQRGRTLQGINIGNKQMKKIIIAAGIMLLSIIVIITITVIYITKAELLTAGMKYGIIIDPQVTQTRHIVYQWPAEKKRSTGVVTQKHLCKDAATGTGIFEYKENPKEAIESLLPCLNVTKNIIPKEQHNETQIHFIASTGLRLFYARDNATVIKILSAIQVLFDTLPFIHGRVHILSKKEEAIYGWITVNYLKGDLLKIDDLQQHRRSSGTTGTLALVGGATHITYVPKKIPKQIRDLTKYTLFGHRYRIYIQSFDCFGWMEAELRLMVILYQISGGKTILENPCWPLGYNTTITMHNLFESVCTALNKPAKYLPDSKIIYTGDANSTTCQQLIHLLFDYNACFQKPYCAFNGIYIPKIHGQFLAFGKFFFVRRALRLPISFTVTQYKDALESFCKNTWDQLKILFPKVRHRFIRSQCFGGIYAYTILVYGFKFTPENWKQIRFTNNVSGTQISWSLGYMLSITNKIPRHIQGIKTPISQTTFRALFFSFLIIGMVCVTFIFKVICS